ncbi:MAG TPA: VanZ family protein [Burkholderiaceae bacterium]|nr:VanZ family protein [Burkholderiaceae bacterium]
MKRAASSSVPLAAAYGALVVYATLYPFSGWHHPQGLWSLAFLSLPWPKWWDRFDIVANLVGYLPLGALVYIAALRSGSRRAMAALLGFALPSLMSLAMELLQNYLPQRVPSAADWALNSAGAAIGMLLAALADRFGLTLRWHALRDRWFAGRSAVALTLLLLWPFGMLFPTPVPLGLGAIGLQLREAAADVGAWLQDIPWAAPWGEVLLEPAAMPAAPLSPLAEGTLTAFGLLAPCLLAFSISLPGWRRIALVFGASVLGLAAMTLSAALNYGPEHALAWRTATTQPAVLAAMLLAAACAGVSRRTAAALGLVVATVLAVLAAQAPGDPYFAHALQAWERGRFIRFHGVAQWIGWLWPYAVLAHLLRRIVARDDDRG